jgi:hypothetical protein
VHGVGQPAPDAQERLDEEVTGAAGRVDEPDVVDTSLVDCLG